jgi:hypothetical protein
MRYVVLILFFTCSIRTGRSTSMLPASDVPTENKVFLITLDGFRWQELFSGADSALLHNSRFTNNVNAAKEQFWGKDGENRRKKLMPFFWKVLSRQGQLFGNRAYDNRVDVTNPYRLSYPGYNEILTGKADAAIYSNRKRQNRNTTLLEYLNEQPAYNGNVAAFTSWNLFTYILNERRSGVHINCRNDKKAASVFKKSAAALPHFYDKNGNTRNDWTTFTTARDYIMKHQPKMVFISLGGTDEYAHQKKYDAYLQQAQLADTIIAELWNLVQSSSFYKGQTTFVITTDHGRGGAENNWHKHGFLTKGSSETWMALLGNGIQPVGEHTTAMQLYQAQVAGTVSNLLGVRSFERQSIPVSFYTAPLAKRQ